ncbi:hypothetical protein ACT8ZV_05690 [Nocardioides sp. MAHUQ-72]
MAASRIIEQESGTWTGRIHPHNGYYAGDFWGPRQDDRDHDQQQGSWH